MGWWATRPEVPTIWDAVSRLFPTTAMLSTVGGCWSWAASAAGPPTRRATAAAMEK
jgi:hypothetical protein